MASSFLPANKSNGPAVIMKGSSKVSADGGDDRDLDADLLKAMKIIQATELTPEQQHEIMTDSLRNW
jgi:hypothetical protein